MKKVYKILSLDASEGLYNLFDAMKARKAEGFARKVGLRGRLSSCYVYKYNNFSRRVKQKYKELIPEALEFIRNESHFLLLKPGDSLDLEKRENSLFDLMPISLMDGQQIVVNEKSYVLNRGEGIRFAASESHEIPETKTTRLFLVFIIVRNLQGDAYAHMTEEV